VTAPATVLQAASVLLQYPDERVRAAFPVVREAAPVVRGALDALEAMTPLALQEHYVQVLDQKRQCCLYLTWWTEGETRRRGLALAQTGPPTEQVGLDGYGFDAGPTSLLPTGARR
jgi:nitrate reductase delta subunit